MTDFRARCAELAEAGAEGPSDKELLAEAAKTLGYLSTPPWEFDLAPMSVDDLLTVQRAAIAADRAKQQPDPGEVQELVAWLRDNANDEREMSNGANPASRNLDRAADLLAQRHPQPVPVTERLPGPDDLGGFDSNCCWWGHWQDGRWIWIWDCEPVRNETHWLPANTPILPAGAIRQS